MYVTDGCRYNGVMIQSISHERTRGMSDVMSAASSSSLLRSSPSVRLAIFNRQSRERRGERRDNCDYCEFSGARNYVNEVEESERVKG